MKLELIILLLTSAQFSCNPKKLNSQDFDKSLSKSVQQAEHLDSTKNVLQEADSLMYYYKLAITSSLNSKMKFDQLFFHSFPGTFYDMQMMFGYDDGKGGAPLYYEGEEIINYFENLTSIHKVEYYTKYVGICINGIWQADNIATGFGFAEKLINDCPQSCLELSKKSDTEIRSVFHFIFDGPHPKNDQNQNTYKRMIASFSPHNQRLANLLSESFKEVMLTDDDHGE